MLHMLDRRSFFAAVLCFTYVVFGVHLACKVISAFVAKPVSEGLANILTSPWAIAASLNCIVGAVFNASYLYLRRGPSLLMIPSSVIALAVPLVGNFLLLFYVAVLVAHARNTVSALTPGVDDESTTQARSRAGPHVALSVFGILLFACIAYAFYALYNEPLSEGIDALRNEIWATATVEDNLAGILFTATLIIVREGSLSLPLLFWLAGLLFLGNAVTCLYAIGVAREALRNGVTFRKALLTQLSESQDCGTLTTQYSSTQYSAI